tara:strand:+ start:219 stop:914 length:696 start_codon:yes stop_codon:yes gene_type:complete
MFENFQIIGHRGWKAKYPENTMLGFKKAIEAGATMIEFDVQLTRDHHLAVFHDQTAKRVCGRNINIGRADRPDLAELKVLETDNCIPFVDEVFDTFTTDVNYYVELKTYKLTTEEQKIKLAYYTFNEIVKHGVQNNTVIVAWEEGLLNLCRRLGFVNLGVNYDKGMKPFRAKVSCSNHSLIKSTVTEPTYAWTVNNVRRMKTLLKHNVTGIITDHVDKLVNVCKQQEVSVD